MASANTAQGEQPARAPRPRLVALAGLAALVLLLHAPFVNRAVQFDDVNYLDLAENALRRPFAPNDLPYVFQGRLLDMAGHSHPPLNAYLLAALLKLRGGFSEPFFHTAYLLFPLLSALAMYFLAARYTPRPWLAAALFASAPVVQVASHSLESDSPTLAFALCGMALFIYGVDEQDSRKLLAGGVSLALAGMGALQALFLLPVAALYLWIERQRAARSARLAAFACALPALVFVAWQLFQAAMLGRVPAAVLGGYIVSYGYLAASHKLLNFLALVQHAAVLAVFLPVLLVVFGRQAPRWAWPPALAAAAFGAWRLDGYRGFERVLFLVFFSAGLLLLAALAKMAATTSEHRDTRFLSAWFLVYFAACLAAFFAGAARYLLPGLPPLVILCVRRFGDWRSSARSVLPTLALAGNLVLGLPMAHADYRAAGAYRGFARELKAQLAPGEHFLFNGEWGFRYYMRWAGGEIVWERSTGKPGELLVSSRLALGDDHDSAAEEAAVPAGSRWLSARTPLRLIDVLGEGDGRRPARAGFFSAAFGVLPFSFSRGPLDEIRLARVSPWIALLPAPSPQPPGSDLLLTQVGFPEGRRLVLRQAPGSGARFTIPAAWRRLSGALFARGTGSARFAADLDDRALLDTPLRLDARSSALNAWVPFVIELPPHSEGARLTLRIEAPRDLLVGWGALFGE